MSKPRCHECGLKIRGPKHTAGQDHQKRAAARAGSKTQAK